MNIEVSKLDYIASADDTIEEAWTKIESNKHRSVIVVEDDKLVGTLSDGDLRKAMLKHRLMSTPIREVMNVNFTSLSEEERGRAEEIFTQRDIFLIPIVDMNLKLIDIVVR